MDITRNTAKGFISMSENVFKLEVLIISENFLADRLKVDVGGLKFSFLSKAWLMIP